MKNKDLEAKLIVGAKILIGKKYAKFSGVPSDAGKEITLVEGYFECDNGLYTEVQTAPSIWDEGQKEFESIYHMFGNDLEDFMDCKIVK